MLRLWLTLPFFYTFPSLHPSISPLPLFTAFCTHPSLSLSPLLHLLLLLTLPQGAGGGQGDGRVPQTEAHATGQTGQSGAEWVFYTISFSSEVLIQQKRKNHIYTPYSKYSRPSHVWSLSFTSLVVYWSFEADVVQHWRPMHINCHFNFWSIVKIDLFTWILTLMTRWYLCFYISQQCLQK